jgi:hypothetical protein
MSDSRGQSVAEYSIAIAFVLAAVIGMQIYAKRSIQARVKKAVDTLVAVDPTAAGVDAAWISGWQNIAQYEPYYSNTSTTSVRGEKFDELYSSDGSYTRTGVLSLVERSGTEDTSGAMFDSDADGIADTNALTQDDDWSDPAAIVP